MMSAGVALLVALTLAPAGARAQAQPGGSGSDRDASKRETIRGVIAAVAVEGETVIDQATRRAQIAEAAHLTVVGSPVRQGSAAGDAKDNTSGDQGRSDNPSGSARRRHNVYVVWLNPRTEVRDATGPKGSDKDKDRQPAAAPGSNRAAFDKIEVGDQVEVTFVRRELATSGGNTQQALQMQRHGWDRTYFGDAVSITILSEPTPPGAGDRGSSRAGERDDDRDKIKKP
jgi:hypothetical protein